VSFGFLLLLNNCGRKRCWILALSTEKLPTAIVAYIMRIWAVGSNTLGAPIGEDPFK
jgi:hypothetical protein